MTWRDKANRIITDECWRSWASANKLSNGRTRKRHVPYSVPEIALTLIDCLNRDDEETAKALFINRAFDRPVFTKYEVAHLKHIQKQLIN